MTSKLDTASAGDDFADSEKVFTFEDDPSLKPHNWSNARKALILAISYACVANSTIGTSLASGGVESTLETFGLRDDFGWRVLPISIYLVGYVLGGTTFGPLSENYGRKTINLVTAFASMIWMMACALAPNWAVLNVFRLLNGFFAAGATSTMSGICADLYGEDTHRGHALLGYNMFSNLGPVLGPVISGWAVMDNWRLSFWIGLAYGGLCFLAVLVATPETNHKTLQDKRAKKLRAANGTPVPHGPYEHENIKWHEIMTKVIVRPLVMLYSEPLVLFTCTYIAFQYAVFYMFLQSYPLIFGGIYGFNTGEVGLAFLGLGAGVLLAPFGLYIFDAIYTRASSRDEAWTKHQGAKRLPIAAASGPLIVLSLFWNAWTSRSSVHWISPVLSGIPYGLGFTLNQNALLNYMVDSYAAYASSTNSASTVTRQTLGAALPFAVVPMYRTLGVAWAGSLLGFVAIATSLIPVAFWIYGEKMLENSQWAQELARQKSIDTQDEKD